MKTQLQRAGDSPEQKRRVMSEVLRRVERSGMCKIWPAATAPTGYLAIDGAERGRIEFASIFKVIGTTYGAGNGTTTFNMPNWGSPAPGAIWIMKV